jgi:dethiobiotin synthetase
MSDVVVVAGTDTGIGKTVFSAGLAGALEGCYLKPVQSGLEGETDRDVVRRLSGLGEDRLLKEIYKLSTPVSPHRSAEIDGISIDMARLALPRIEGYLIVEAAGGVLTPLTRTSTFADLFAAWQAPVVLCARTTLGTINHTLLSLEALRARRIPVAGVAFIGEANEDSERTICQMGTVHRLGRLPILSPLAAATLARAFAAGFDLAPFRSERRP